jgi:hypothetical protein
LQDQLVKLIRADLKPDCPPQRVRDLCERYLLTLKDPVEVYELLDRSTARVQKSLIVLRQALIESGDALWFEFNSVSDDYIQGPYYAESGDPEDVKQAKRNRLLAAPMQAALESLHFSEFEVVCAAVLRLLGARHTHLTQRSRDQGIDFYGRLVLGDLDTGKVPFLRFSDALHVWIVGQAKHYVGGKVSAPEIRNLVGSINLARFKEYASETELMEGLRLRSCDPVFALFLTTGTFSRDAARLAYRSGVVLKDVGELARLLVDKMVVGCDRADQVARERLVYWARRTIDGAAQFHVDPSLE